MNLNIDIDLDSKYLYRWIFCSWENYCDLFRIGTNHQLARFAIFWKRSRKNQEKFKTC